LNAALLHLQDARRQKPAFCTETFRIGVIRSLTTFYPDTHREHHPAAPHACELPPRLLARTLLLLARYGKESQPQKMLPQVSQEMLAEMIGTTRSRVNFFMNKFRKLGFIHYNGGLQVHNSLLSVVLHD
jgi:hypothetical protein